MNICISSYFSIKAYLRAFWLFNQLLLWSDSFVIINFISGNLKLSKSEYVFSFSGVNDLFYVCDDNVNQILM